MGRDNIIKRDKIPIFFEDIKAGYSGGERYIDLNVFNGDEKAFKKWLTQHKIRNKH